MIAPEEKIQINNDIVIFGNLAKIKKGGDIKSNTFCVNREDCNKTAKRLMQKGLTANDSIIKELIKFSNAST